MPYRLRRDECVNSRLEEPSSLSKSLDAPKREPTLERLRARIYDYRAKLGEEAWLCVLGNYGATSAGEITSITQAQAIGAQLKETLAQRA